jgi:hypothetical protein
VQTNKHFTLLVYSLPLRVCVCELCVPSPKYQPKMHKTYFFLNWHIESLPILFLVLLVRVTEATMNLIVDVFVDAPRVVAGV